MLGWTAPDIRGRPVDVFFTPEDRAAGVPEAEMQAALKDGCARDERWHVRNDDSLVWASCEIIRLKDHDGHPDGFVKILRDGTRRRTAETRQRADAEFLQTVLAASGDCIKVLDFDGRLTFMNQAGLRLMEVSDFSAIRGCPWPDFWQDASNLQACRAVQAARDGGTGHFQGSALTLAGTLKYWDVQVTPIRDANGVPERLLVVSRDITASRRAEEALREAEALNASILEASRDCIVVLDLEGRISFVSPGGIASMEVDDPASAIGESWLALWKGDEQAAAQAAVAEARAGRTGQFRGFCPTLKGRPKWWDLVVSLLPGRDGKPDRLMSIGRDITEAHETQARLFTSEERLNLALGASGMVGVWDCDLQKGLVFGDVNFARAHAIDPAQAAAGAPITEIFSRLHPDDLPQFRAQIAKLLEGGDDFAIEHRLMRPDGSMRWVLAKGRLVRDAAGLPVRLPGALVDVTERREAEERQRMLMEELAHRVKNTLAVVQSIARQTLRGEGEIALGRDAFAARLQALSAAHDVLLMGDWSEASLRTLVEAGVRLHAVGDEGRFRINGPEVMLGSKAALSFSLVLHEMGTNAAKYGALSVTGGTVDISWTLDLRGGRQHLHFIWQELGGPLVADPVHRGFGSRLIERSLASDLGAAVELKYLPQGVRLTLDAPLATIQRT